MDGPPAVPPPLRRQPGLVWITRRLMECWVAARTPSSCDRTSRCTRDQHAGRQTRFDLPSRAGGTLRDLGMLTRSSNPRPEPLNRIDVGLGTAAQERCRQLANQARQACLGRALVSLVRSGNRQIRMQLVPTHCDLHGAQ